MIEICVLSKFEFSAHIHICTDVILNFNQIKRVCSPKSIEKSTYFDNFQWVAFGIRTAGRRENGTGVGQMQNGIVVVALKEITLKFLV